LKNYVQLFIKIFVILFVYKSGINHNVQVSHDLLIIGGRDAEIGEVPYQVSMQKYRAAGYEHWCGGVIYDSTHILTAAHCLSAEGPSLTRILAGTISLSNSSYAAQIRNVSHQLTHPGYTGGGITM